MILSKPKKIRRTRSKIMKDLILKRICLRTAETGSKSTKPNMPNLQMILKISTIG